MRILRKPGGDLINLAIGSFSLAIGLKSSVAVLFFLSLIFDTLFLL